jgi:hypothetical protein
MKILMIPFKGSLENKVKENSVLMHLILSNHNLKNDLKHEYWVY